MDSRKKNKWDSKKNANTGMEQSNCTDEEEVGKPSKLKSVNVNVNANDDVSMAHSNGTNQEGASTVLNNTKDIEINMVQNNKEIEKRTNNTSTIS